MSAIGIYRDLITGYNRSAADANFADRRPTGSTRTDPWDQAGKWLFRARNR